MGHTRSRTAEIGVTIADLAGFKERSQSVIMRGAQSARHTCSDIAAPIASNRVPWLKVTVAVGLLSGFLLSHGLWISSRSYPVTPVHPLLRSVRFPFDYAVFALLLALLAFIAFAKNPARLIAAFVILALVWALFDQSRWQPWFYQYLFMLSALGLWFSNRTDPLKREAALNACRLIIVSIYFWSGIQKLNPEFVRGTFPWMLAPLTGIVPAALMARAYSLAVVAPFVELAIAVGLLSQRFRNAAVFVAVAMHLFILASIGPFGRDYNNVIWPWNVAMLASVPLLFWGVQEVRATNVLWGRKLAFQKLVLALFAIAPVMSLVNRWDTFLSFSLYTGNRDSATIYMAAPVAVRLPENVQELISEEDPQDPSRPDSLEVSDWSWDELNVPPYPEIRIFKNIGKEICREASQPSDVNLVIRGKTTWFLPTQQLVYDCATLAN